MLSRRDFIGHAKGAALTIPFLGLMGCDDTGEDAMTKIEGQTMGTTYSVKIANAEGTLDVDTLATEIAASLDEVDTLMSTYKTASELSLFNNDAANTPRALSSETARVIQTALNAAEATGGAFDPTIGPLVDLWGFGPAGTRNDVPGTEAIMSARATVGHQQIVVSDSTFSKTNAATRLDLSGIAKGYGVDKIAELLNAKGFDNYLVEVGGEIRAKGVSTGDRAWRLGIEKPDPLARDVQYVVNLDGHAMATSGNYRIFFEAEGARFAHIIDPRTGEPTNHNLASVTVLAKSTMEADALSTAMLVMGPEDAMEFAATHEIAAFFITGENGRFSDAASPAFEKLFAA